MAHVLGQSGQAVDRGVVVRRVVGRGAEAEGEQQLDGAADVQDDVAQPDDLRGDVADAVDAEQQTIVCADDQLQEPAVAGDGTARSPPGRSAQSQLSSWENELPCASIAGASI